MVRLTPGSTALLVVDVQERLAAAMPSEAMAELKRAAHVLIESAARLGAPVFATEQYPKGLGPTLPEVHQLLERVNARRFEKLCFSAGGVAEFVSELERAAARAVVVIGMEAHVCVFQTVRDLVSRGLEVHVPLDGVVSRREDHRAAGLQLCERAGAFRTTSETVAFDWLERAGTEDFKAISRLVR